jgi:hypothetical protein
VDEHVCYSPQKRKKRFGPFLFALAQRRKYRLKIYFEHDERIDELYQLPLVVSLHVGRIYKYPCNKFTVVSQ